MPTITAMKPRAATALKQSQILAEAETQFGCYGFEGVTLDSIASALTLSRQNLLYYYASKEELYAAVLNAVVQSWLQSMEVMRQDDDPASAIARYIAAKLRFSRERPQGSAVFTREIMAGAPRYREQLAAQVLPRLRAEVRQFKRWSNAGLIAPVDFTHLMFIIWGATQAYADLAPQFALMLGKPKLSDSDFANAHAALTQMVLATLIPPGRPPSP